MSDIIEKMAGLEIPEELLKRIDINEVLEKFRRNFSKLDALKKARSKHESQNAFMRWWNNDELEEAQLDAQQLQAEFSKTLGQLMLLSMLQSQRLSTQQQQLARQQDEMLRQSDLIKAQAGELAKQQVALFAQSKELEQLVTQYFDLRGLTQEGAKQLIEIASEVKNTKDALLARFNEQLRETAEHATQLRSRADQLTIEVSGALQDATLCRADVEERIDTFARHLANDCATRDDQLDSFQQQIASLKEALSTQRTAADHHRVESTVQLRQVRLIGGVSLIGMICTLAYVVVTLGR